MAVRYARPKGRFYPTPDGEFPSVTNILGVIGKPALVPWAAKMERELVASVSYMLHDKLRQAVEPVGKVVYLRELEALLGKEKAHSRKMGEAAEIGSALHAYIEWVLRGDLGMERGPEPPLPPAARIAYDGFTDWRQRVELQPLEIERTVWSASHKYAGTMDLLALVTGIRTMIDFKTSRQVYRESHLQVAAYNMAWAEMGNEPADQGLILRLPKTEADASVDPFEAVTLNNLGELYDIFLNARALWGFINEEGA